MRVSRVVAAVVGCVALWSGPVRADEAPLDCAGVDAFVASFRARHAGAIVEEDLRPVYSVSAGGVSLGSYQAGRLHHWLNRRRAAFALLRADLATCAAMNPALGSDVGRALHPESIGVRVAVGASAGAISSLLIGLEACRDSDHVEAADSLLFLTWVAIGFRRDTKFLDGSASVAAPTPGLLEGAEGAAESLFNVQPLTRVRNIIGSYLDPARRGDRPDTWPEIRFRAGCEVGLGHTLLRTKSRLVRVDSGQAVGKTLTDRLLVKLSTGPEAASTLRLSVDDAALAHPRIKGSGRYVGIDGALETVLRSYQAAGAFPIAFPFVALAPDTPGGLACRNPTPGLVAPGGVPEGPDCAYLDGGGLNNGPIDVALDRFDIDPDAPKSPRPFERPVFVYLDQDLTPFPGIASPQGRAGASYFANLQNYASEAPEVITTQQAAAGVQSALARQSDQLDVRVIGRGSATFGEFLQSMSGFPDARLRAADFLAGLRDTEMERAELAPAGAVDPLAAEVLRAYTTGAPITDAGKFPSIRALSTGVAGKDNGLDTSRLPELLRLLGEHHRVRMSSVGARPPETDELVESQTLIRNSAAGPLFDEMFQSPSHAGARLQGFAEAQADSGGLVPVALQLGGMEAFRSLLPAGDFSRRRLETLPLPGLSALRFGLAGGYAGGFEVAVVAPGRWSLFGGVDTGFALTGFLGLGLADFVRIRGAVVGYTPDRTRYDTGNEPVPHVGIDVLPLRFAVWNPLAIPGLTLSLGATWLRLDAGFLRPMRQGYGVLVDLSVFSRFYVTARYDMTTAGGLLTLGTHGGSIGVGMRF